MKKRMQRGLLLFMLMFALVGCGADSAQEETMQEETTGESVTEETVEEEEAVEETVDEKDSAAETGKNQAEKSEVEIDEVTREELTTQLLEENAMDTSIVENTKATRGCTFTLPEGFEEAEDMPGMYVTKRYPIDASTIYYVEMSKDISLQLMTEETFLEQMQSNFKQIYGTEVDVELKSFERIKIDGYPAFRILCSYMVDGIEITQLEYAINADKSYVITYSQTNEYDRMEAFEASAATIALEY